ncbi:MAG: DNA mismatch repair protein MutL [Crocinitomicaceae bacterium]|nr:DNA mismatch repair protein MutL [Crocinitomicaceae bacterium]
MPEVIRQLPENVANQIAAGEVIQRPASAVKELMENAVDAGASRIDLRVVDAGRTLIHVMDNGVGMVGADAKRCFDRHATSKITSVDDLFTIVSKGFRGEALSSIASIAHVELKTRHSSDDCGIQLNMEGGTLVQETPVAMDVGTQIAVRHLFFNVPARRNFLKSDAVEMRHVIDEFHRVALAHEAIHFTLTHNDRELFDLRPYTLRKRVIGVFGSKYDERLIPVEESTDVVGVRGFVGKPAFARRTRGEQFLFVNQRFVKHGPIHRTIMHAYEGLLPPGQYPLYVLFLTIDPARLDVNIHPTKTEIKCDEDQHIQSLLLPSIRRGLGKHAVAPSLDFDQESSLNIAPLPKDHVVAEPVVQVNTDYNPFQSKATSGGFTGGGLRPGRGQMDAWKALYQKAWQLEGDEGSVAQEERAMQSLASGEVGAQLAAGDEVVVKQSPLFQLQNKYIVTATKSGLLVIDQHRAHQRILYEELVRQLELEGAPAATQQLLFPEAIDLNAADQLFVLQSRDWLAKFGLLVAEHDDGVEVQGMPMEADTTPESLIQAILDERAVEVAGVSREERVAARLAASMAVRVGKALKPEEMVDLVDRLFGCSTPALDPFGRAVIITFETNELEQRFR